MLRVLFLSVFLSLNLTAIAGETVYVEMVTSEGSFTLELYPTKAPITVRNFLKYVDGGHYEGAAFYRTVTYENDNGHPKIEVIQGGIGDAADSLFPPIKHESTSETGILHTDGVISMSRFTVGSASSEFFICIGDQPGLDHGQPRNADMQGFAAFGRVVEGMDVVRVINELPAKFASDDPYTKGQMIAEPAVISKAVRK